MAHTSVERTATMLSRRLAALRPLPGNASHDGPSAAAGRGVFQAMVTSRLLDAHAADLVVEGQETPAVVSAGHEDNAMVGWQLTRTDPAFLERRAGAFVAARRREDLDDFVTETVAALQGSVTAPMSAGHVWGSRPCWIPPQDSAGGVHLPRAVGTAVAVGRAATGRLVTTALTRELGTDAIVCVTFTGEDTTDGAVGIGMTMARWARRMGAPVPALFVCEDARDGPGVITPRGWVDQTLSALPGVSYVKADGDLAARWEATSRAIARVRGERTPVILHLPTVRLTAVDPSADVSDPACEMAGNDPILRAARWLVEAGVVSSQTLREDLQQAVARVRKAAADVAVAHPSTPQQVIGSLAAPFGATHPSRYVPTARAREASWAGTDLELPELATAVNRRTYVARLNQGLADLLEARPETVVFGPHVGGQAGAHAVTEGLQGRFGTDRVFDALRDETAVLGTAQGFGLVGYLPVPELSSLSDMHGLRQLREACTTAWRSDGAFGTPMVVRIPGLTSRSGDGCHAQNDAVGALREIPGLVLSVPSRGDDAVRMLRGAAALACEHARVVAVLEPVARYLATDLYDDGDHGWLTGYPVAGQLMPGQAGVYPAGLQDVQASESQGARVSCAPPVTDTDGSTRIRLGDGADVLIVTYGNGVAVALRAAARLLDSGLRARILDLRWLRPLPMAAVVAHARDVGRMLVVDECRATGGGIADAVIAGLVEQGSLMAIASVRASDSFAPDGPGACDVLVSDTRVVTSAQLLARSAPRR